MKAIVLCLLGVLAGCNNHDFKVGDCLASVRDKSDYGGPLPKGTYYHCIQAVGEDGALTCQSDSFEGANPERWYACQEAMTWYELAREEKVACPAACPAIK